MTSYKRTYIPTVYLMDDRPGEEMTAIANTAEQVAAFLAVIPDLKVVSKAEYDALERRMSEVQEVE